jgi:hypothetical protein
LATARLDIESTKGSSFMAVRHMLEQLSRLWLYPWAGCEQ